MLALAIATNTSLKNVASRMTFADWPEQIIENHSYADVA
jgi:hypothetical protein